MRTRSAREPRLPAMVVVLYAPSLTTDLLLNRLQPAKDSSITAAKTKDNAFFT